MKKGDIIEGIIESVDYPNRGRVTVDGEKILVKNGIPGQKVRLQINKKRSGRLEARLLEVLERSPLETRESACREFPACGGCMYQTMSYEEQCRMKEEQIRRLLSEVPGLSVEDGCWEGILGSPREFGYRNKMEFSFGDEYKDGPLTLGLHKKGSTYDVISTPDCALVHPDLQKIVECTWRYFKETGLPHYHKITHKGVLRHLLLRRGNTTGEILVHLVTTGSPEITPHLQPWMEQVLALPLSGKIVGVLHLKNDALSDTVQSDETTVLAGRDHFYEKLLDLEFRISTFSFFQPNSFAAELLYKKVREYIGDTSGRVVFDLYSGTGTIAQLAAPVAKEVVGIEIVEEAVRAARENAERNGLINCRFLCGDVLKVLDEVEQKPDVIILDPPRDGIHPKALPKILQYGVETIVYISCKATSLARDLPAFFEAGYQVEKVCCLDQFAQCVHIETICLLSNRNQT